MQKRLWALMVGGLTLAVAPAVAQQQLQLTNGDRLTGTLKGIDAGSWVFEHAGGELKIAPADVASFSSTSSIGVRLSDGSIVAGTVTTAANQLRLSVTDGSTRTVGFDALVAVGDPANLAALEPVRIGYFSPMGMFWGATASLGFTNQSGNSKSRGIDGALEVGRNSPKDRITLKLGAATQSSDLGTGDLEKTVERYWGSLRVDLFVGPRFFFFAQTSQQRDQFQDIDLRSNYDAGIGIQVIQNATTDLRFNASGGYRREAFTSGGTSTTPTIGGGTGLRQVLGPALLAWDLNWSPSTKDFNDYRLVSDASLTTTVYKGLGFRIGVRNEVNNNPPPGIGKGDMLITTSLTYTIGR